MNSIIFGSKVINKKQSFTAQDIAELKEITEKYPYFQLAAMLYSKALLKTNHTDYKKVLAKTATTVNNREQLFSYLYSELYTADNSPVVTEKSIPKPIIKKEVIVKPIAKPIVKTVEEPVAKLKTNPIVKAEVKPKENPFLEIIAKPKAKPAIEKVITEKPVVKQSEVLEEVKVEATKEEKLVSSTTNIKSTSEIQMPKPIISNGKEIKNKKDLMQVVAGNLKEGSSTKAQGKLTLDDNKNKGKKILKIEKKKAVVKAKTEGPKVVAKPNRSTLEVAATEVLEVKATTKVKEVAAPKKTKTVKAKTDKDSETIDVKKAVVKKKATTKAQPKKETTKEKTVKAKKATTKSAEVKPTKAKTVKPKKVKAKTVSELAEPKTTKKTKIEAIKPVDRKTSITIMEKFIKDDPSINKPEDKAYTEELAIAKSSVREDYNIVSETMAKLYATQGNIKKAKKVYEKLILIYPEKNTYFAARISELK